MHPVHNETRRQGRASALHKRFSKSEDVVYLDATEYTSHDAMALALVNRDSKYITSGTVRIPEPEVAEEVAVALAILASSKTKVIVSDTKSAIRNYSRRFISPAAFLIIKSGFTMKQDGRIQLIWVRIH